MDDSVPAEPGIDYYDGPDLVPAVVAAIEAAGLSADRLDSDDLAALDEFHALGRAATVALARLAAIRPGERVVDVGAGIGGPARALARHFGARVTAVDPVGRFCALNRLLTERTGLGDRVEVRQASGRRLPFPDGSFDVAWSQAVWPNVPDKAAHAAEIARVLRPGGRLALHEVVAGPGGPIEYPVPWAEGPRESFLVGELELRDLLESAGFETDAWQDRAAMQRGLEAALAGGRGMAAGHPDLSLTAILPDLDERMAVVGRNVADQRIGLVSALLVRR